MPNPTSVMLSWKPSSPVSRRTPPRSSVLQAMTYLSSAPTPNAPRMPWDVKTTTAPTVETVFIRTACPFLWMSWPTCSTRESGSAKSSCSICCKYKRHWSTRSRRARGSSWTSTPWVTCAARTKGSSGKYMDNKQAGKQGQLLGRELLNCAPSCRTIASLVLPNQKRSSMTTRPILKR